MTTIRRVTFLVPAFVALLCAAAPAFAAMDIEQAKKDGLVGEQFNGLIGPVSSNPTVDVTEFVTEINDGRMQYYQSLAEQTGKPLALVQHDAGKNFILMTPPGEYIMDPVTGAWIKKPK